MVAVTINSARDALNNRDFANAIEQYQFLLSNAPFDASLYLELSSCMMGNGQIDEALVIAKQAKLYAQQPMKLHCDLQLATIYLMQERFSQAGQLFHAILNTRSNLLEARIGLSKLYLKTGLPFKAHEILHAMPAPNDANWVTNMSLALFNTRKCDEAISLCLEHMNNFGVHSTILSNVFMFCNYTESHAQFQHNLQNLMQQAYPSLEPDFANSTQHSRGKTLRIGFVSADFLWHPVGYFTHSFLPHLRHYDIKTILYSNSAAEDSLTAEFRKSASEFKYIGHLDTNSATDVIRKDKLDILIDLSGHSAGHRLDIFHKRAAFIQVSYLGYTESTHLAQMDYIFTDKFHVSGENQPQFSEKIKYFPTTRFCFSLPMNAPEIMVAPIEENGYLTLGSFSNPAKIGPQCVKIWGEILLAFPTARLKLRHKNWDDTQLRTGLLNEFISMGISQGRIEFYGEAKYDRYLVAHHEVDVIIDTTPFSGGTTTCEALWMGVPTVTFMGKMPAAQQGVSILSAINEEKWSVDTVCEAISVLEQVCQSPKILQDFKADIRGKFSKSPLGDGKLFAEHFSNLLRSMFHGE